MISNRVLTPMEQFHKETAERFVKAMREAYHEFLPIATHDGCVAGCVCGWKSTGPAYDSNEGARQEWYYMHLGEDCGNERITSGAF
jgi:hypothetical protein